MANKTRVWALAQGDFGATDDTARPDKLINEAEIVIERATEAQA
jgi:hypothetical protein